MAIIHECDKCEKTSKEDRFLQYVQISLATNDEWYYKDLCQECIDELEEFLTGTKGRL